MGWLDENFDLYTHLEMERWIDREIRAKRERWMDGWNRDGVQ